MSILRPAYRERKLLLSAADRRLERAIAGAYQKLLRASTSDIKRAAWSAMRALIASRSSAAIEYLELIRGLRHA